MAELGWGAGGVAEAISAIGQLQQQQQSKQMFPLQMQEAALKISDESLKVQSGQIALKQQQTELSMLNQLAADGKLGPGQKPEDQLATLANVDIAAGRTKEASEKLEKASTIASNNQKIASEKASTEIAVWKTVGSALGDAHDEAGYAQAKIVFMFTHPDMAKLPDVQKILQLPYSPELVQHLQDYSQTRLQAAQETAAKASAEHLKAETKLAPHRAALLDAQRDNQNSLAENRKAAGAKSLIPKAHDVNDLVDAIKQKYGDLSDPEQMADMRSRATRATERMLELQRSGVPRSAAIAQAFDERDKDGDFRGLKLRGAMGRPSSPEKPLKVPASKDKMEDNSWYDVGGVPKYYVKAAGALYTREQLAELAESEGSSADDEEEEQ